MPFIPASQRKKHSMSPQSEEARESYLAALTCTDTIVVSRGLVLADEAGLVDSGRGWRGRRAGDQLLRTGALRLDRCRECKKRRKKMRRLVFKRLMNGFLRHPETPLSQLFPLNFRGPDTGWYQLLEGKLHQNYIAELAYGLMLEGWLDCDFLEGATCY